MTLRSATYVVVPSLALVAAAGAGIFLAIEHAPRPSPGISAAAPPTIGPRQEAAPAAGPRAGGTDAGQSQATSAPRQALPAQSDVAGLSAALGAPKPDAAMAPKFDVARIDGPDNAVIAGTAAPGATVELLCGATPCARAEADQAGQFVMIPPRLPAGSYELTLKSRRPDGQELTSARGVAVSLAPRAADRTGGSVSEPRTAGVAGTAPVSHAAPVDAPDKAARAEPSAGGTTSAIPVPKTALVSRGDSLWRISRSTYGDGARYPVIFKANRKKIRNPDLIYPGQSFVLPDKAR